jgi:hypothetical protein
MVSALGYAASLVILVSLTMKSIVRLRWINAAGSALFVVFAILTRSWPTVAMNLGIIAIDLWYAFRVVGRKEDFRLIHAERSSAFLEFFYRENEAEIVGIFGEEAFGESKGFSYFVRNAEIAGLFAWRENSPVECAILIDFVTERYRDAKIGRYFFSRHLASFREKGYERLVCETAHPRHARYLSKLGFIEERPGFFAKDIRG